MDTKTLKEFIPDLTGLYEATKEFVMERQGDGKYVDLGMGECDCPVFAFRYNYDLACIEETPIDKIRVCCDELQVKFDDDGGWYSVRNSNYIYFVPSIFSIAETVGDRIGA